METSAQILGKELQSKREQLGFSLQDVAQHTRIRKSYLESMEQGQLEDLPGKAYITGFMRVYARHLGLDSDALLARLSAPPEQANFPSTDSDSVSTPETEPMRKSGADKGWGAFVLGFIVVLLLGALLYYLLSSFASEAPVEVSGKEAVEARDSVPQQLTDSLVVAEPDATLEPAVVVESAAALEPAPPLEPSAPLEPADALDAASPPDALVIGQAVAEESPAAVSLPSVPPTGAALRMLALTESSLVIHADDRKPYEYKLSKGLDLTWQIKSSVKVEMAQPGVARFWFGGQELPLEDLGSFQLDPASGE